MKTLKLALTVMLFTLSISVSAQVKKDFKKAGSVESKEMMTQKTERLDKRFAVIDQNNDGKIDSSEMIMATEKRVSKRDLQLTDKKKEKIHSGFSLADANKDGFLDKKEFAIMTRKQVQKKKAKRKLKSTTR